MNCIDFCVNFKYCVKQLMIFGRTVVAASDLKNCTMVNCEIVLTVNPECFSLLLNSKVSHPQHSNGRYIEKRRCCRSWECAEVVMDRNDQ